MITNCYELFDAIFQWVYIELVVGYKVIIFRVVIKLIIFLVIINFATLYMPNMTANKPQRGNLTRPAQKCARCAQSAPAWLMTEILRWRIAVTVSSRVGEALWDLHYYRVPLYLPLSLLTSLYLPSPPKPPFVLRDTNLLSCTCEGNAAKVNRNFLTLSRCMIAMHGKMHFSIFTRRLT